MVPQSRRFPKVRFLFCIYVCRVLCVYTILTGNVNLTVECRRVLLFTSYVRPLRIKV